MGDEASIIDGGDMEEESYTLGGGGETLVTSRVMGATHWALPETSNTAKKFSRTGGRYDVCILVILM